MRKNYYHFYKKSKIYRALYIIENKILKYDIYIQNSFRKHAKIEVRTKGVYPEPIAQFTSRTLYTYMKDFGYVWNGEDWIKDLTIN